MKLKNILLALLLGACMSSVFAFTACKDDDKKNSDVRQEQTDDDDENWTNNY